MIGRVSACRTDLRSWTPPKTSGQNGVELIHLVMSQGGADMAKGTPGFFDVDERLAELSAKG
ncbi:hypothetical protein, partial [Methylocystis sp.]|uniref:hypothetical protein n=1 Tax=Methylocystis sp. TaxID=1911079 RepID=UPI003DA20C8E